jgi:alcohol dehydrogenase class IV
MQFEFSTASKIIFGSGKVTSIGEIVERFGKKTLIVCGAPPHVLTKLKKLLDEKAIVYTIYLAAGEPTINSIQDTLTAIGQTSYACIIGIGGGSAIDTAKTISAMLTNPGDLTDYLEVIGLNKSLKFPTLPLIAIPTTAGTGSEVTKNAVIGIPTHRVKVSLRSDYLLPKISLIDPELTLSLPKNHTATTGLDALTQLIEAYTCLNPSPMIDPICIEGITRVARSFFKAYDDGDDLMARENMSLASLFSGIALANVKLGVVHGLAGVIGGITNAPHGAICASLLSTAMSVNIKAIRNRMPNHPVLERYTKVGKVLTNDPSATAENASLWVRNFCHHVKIQPLKYLGLVESDFDDLIERAQQSSSMKGNPIILFNDEIRTILQNSM